MSGVVSSNGIGSLQMTEERIRKKKKEKKKVPCVVQPDAAVAAVAGSMSSHVSHMRE